MFELLDGVNYRVIGIEKLASITEIQKRTPVPFALDLETTGLNPLTGKVATIQFGTLKNVFILDCRGYYTLPEEKQATWRASLREMFAAIPLVIGHNLKFDWKWLKQHFEVRLMHVADTMLQELILHGVGIGKAENMGIAVNMEATGERYGFTVEKGLQTFTVNLDKREDWNNPYTDDFLRYCAQDIYIPLRIYAKQLERIVEENLEHVTEIENLCLPAIAQMELDGCFVDIAKWQAILEKKVQERNLLEKELQEVLRPCVIEKWQAIYESQVQALKRWEAARDKVLETLVARYPEFQGTYTWARFKQEGMQAFREQYPRPPKPKTPPDTVNLASPQQLKDVLETLLGVTLESTDRQHLEEYKHAYPVVARVLDWKHLDKFINAFGYNLLEKVDVDNRIHPTYNQIGAATGRMSCSNPNWQQLPSHEPEETSVRRCVVASPGNVLLTADFSNIEARILADISGDTALLEFFEKGGDLHSTTARLMFNLPDTINPKIAELRPGLTYRSVAKTINFGLVYGMSPVKLGKTLGISTSEATELFNKYFEAYPGIASWLTVTPQLSLERGYSLTVSGRKRFYLAASTEPVYDATRMTYDDFMLHKSNWYKIRGSQERQAKNAPIQGSNADITKVALILLYRVLPQDVKLVACVHDEIVLECPQDKAVEVSSILATAMYKACKRYLTRVHIPPIDVSVAPYWKKD